MLQRHAQHRYVQGEGHKVAEGDLLRYGQQPTVAKGDDEPQVHHQRDQRTEEGGVVDEPHLFLHDDIHLPGKPADDHRLIAECLDGANAADHLFDRLGHAAQGFLAALGGAPDSGSQPFDQHRDEDQRRQSGQGEAPVRMYRHHVKCRRQHGEAAGGHVDAHGSHFPHHFGIAQGVRQQLPGAVPVIIGRRKGAPFPEQLPAQLIREDTPLPVHENASRPSGANADDTENDDESGATGSLGDVQRPMLHTVCEAAEQLRDQYGDHVRRRDQGNTQAIDRPVPVNVGPDHAPTRHICSPLCNFRGQARETQGEWI